MLHNQTKKSYLAHLHIHEARSRISYTNQASSDSEKCERCNMHVSVSVAQATAHPEEPTPSPLFCSPKIESTRKEKTKLNDFDKCVIRHIIHEFHWTNRETNYKKVT